MTTQQEHHHIPVWTLGDRLRKAREDAGLSQSELAAAVLVSRTTVSNAEVGARVPMRGTLKAWAEVTDVPLAWLLTGDATPLPPSGQPVKGINFSDTELMQNRSTARAALRLAA